MNIRQARKIIKQLSWHEYINVLEAAEGQWNYLGWLPRRHGTLIKAYHVDMRRARREGQWIAATSANDR